MIQLKTNEDINRIKEASIILVEALTEIEKNMSDGVTTKELDAIVYDYLLKKGAKPTFLGYFNYPASVCISINNEVIHGIPGPRKIATGDIVSIDLGVTYKGYISDAAKTFAIGKVSEENMNLLKTTRECLEYGINKASTKNRLGDISTAIFKHAQQNGFQVVREYCGHGVGFDLHEDPQIFNYPTNGPNKRLKPGMVLAIEPMLNCGTWQVRLLDDGWTVVTADGKNSAHFEHTIALYEDHTEILTVFS